MAAVFLDTTILIDTLRGRPATVAKLRRLRTGGDVPYTCAINVEEVVRGLRPSEEAEARRLFAGLMEAPLGLNEGHRAGEWRRHFAQRGTTLTQADCLIAASALALGARLATGNPADFPMQELAVEHWPVAT